MRIFSYFFKFVHSKWQILLKKYEITDNILKVYYLVKTWSHRLFKSNKNYRNFYLKSLTVELYFSKYIIFSNELLVEIFSDIFTDIDFVSLCQCLSKQK